MCKIQTPKSTGTVHYENTFSQVSTDWPPPPPPPPPTPKSSQQSKTHISLEHNKSQTQKEKTYKADGFWLQCVSEHLCGLN